MHRDLLGQAFAAMRHDLRKTLLTMAGMSWGIATVVLLLAYGNGFGRAIETIFQSFGATAVGIFPGRTSQQAGGNKAGVQVRFTNDDIELLRNNVPLCKHVVRMSVKQSSVQNGNRTFTMPVNGLDAGIGEIWNLEMAQGRFLDDADNARHGLVAVIGSEARDKLFSGMPSMGENIRIDGVEFQVVGVVSPRMQEGDDDDNRTIYIPYNATLYSYRSASIGSSFAARIAGTMPLTTPTTARIPVATSKIIGETINRISAASACFAIAL